MTNIIFVFFLVFFIFYAFNYIGQKLIAKDQAVHHEFIIILSAVEGILVFVLVGINDKFPFL